MSRQGVRSPCPAVCRIVASERSILSVLSFDPGRAQKNGTPTVGAPNGLRFLALKKRQYIRNRPSEVSHFSRNRPEYTDLAHAAQGRRPTKRLPDFRSPQGSVLSVVSAFSLALRLLSTVTEFHRTRHKDALAPGKRDIFLSAVSFIKLWFVFSRFAPIVNNSIYLYKKK